jgi:hypothetical protein
MKKKDLIDTVSNICLEKNKRVQGYVFLKKNQTQIYWIEKNGPKKSEKKKIELEAFEFSYETTLAMVLPFHFINGCLDWDTSNLV